MLSILPIRVNVLLDFKENILHNGITINVYTLYLINLIQ